MVGSGANDTMTGSGAGSDSPPLSLPAAGGIVGAAAGFGGDVLSRPPPAFRMGACAHGARARAHGTRAWAHGVGQGTRRLACARLEHHNRVHVRTACAHVRAASRGGEEAAKERGEPRRRRVLVPHDHVRNDRQRLVCDACEQQQHYRVHPSNRTRPTRVFRARWCRAARPVSWAGTACALTCCCACCYRARVAAVCAHAPRRVLRPVSQRHRGLCNTSRRESAVRERARQPRYEMATPTAHESARRM
eukprot:6265560-Prymnesium_polylepis.2